jgi:hypothetical protein
VYLPYPVIPVIVLVGVTVTAVFIKTPRKVSLRWRDSILLDGDDERAPVTVFFGV